MSADYRFPEDVEFIVRDGAGTSTIATLSDALAFLKAHPELEHGNRLGTIKRLESGALDRGDLQVADAVRSWLDANDLLVTVRPKTP